MFRPRACSSNDSKSTTARSMFANGLSRSLGRLFRQTTSGTRLGPPLSECRTSVRRVKDLLAPREDRVFIDGAHVSTRGCSGRHRRARHRRRSGSAYSERHENVQRGHDGADRRTSLAPMKDLVVDNEGPSCRLRATDVQRRSARDDTPTVQADSASARVDM